VRDRLADALSVIVRQASLPRAFERVSERAGILIERTGFPILRAIGSGPARVTALAAELGVDLSTMSRQVRALEEAGLITRTPDPADGRAAVLALTPEGVEVLKRLRASRRSLVAEQVGDWDEQDVERLADLLTRLSERFVAERTEEPAVTR
jgi:DNA-binding MarR family transcriptional regulator